MLEDDLTTEQEEKKKMKWENLIWEFNWKFIDNGMKTRL